MGFKIWAEKKGKREIQMRRVSQVNNKVEGQKQSLTRVRTKTLSLVPEAFRVQGLGY